MPLVALDKNWQYNVNQRFLSHGTHLADSRQVLRQGLVNSLLGFFVNPWVCMGSSKGTVGNAAMDGVNRWAADTDLIFAASAGTAHSWSVLEQAGINTNTQICIDLIGHSSNPTTGGAVTFIISPSAGFGSANGGTDGSHTTRPTATDEMVMSSNAGGWLGNTLGSNTSREYIVNVMMSDDGECTRVAVRSPLSATYCAMLMIEKPKNPVVGWADPVFAYWQGAVSGYPSVPTYPYWHNQPLLRARAPIGQMLLTLTSTGWATAPAAQQVTTVNELSGEYEFLGIGLASETVGARGIRHGELFDAYWCSTLLPDGATAPVAGPRQLIVLGDMVWPWPDVVPELN